MTLGPTDGLERRKPTSTRRMRRRRQIIVVSGSVAVIAASIVAVLSGPAAAQSNQLGNPGFVPTGGKYVVSCSGGGNSCPLGSTQFATPPWYAHDAANGNGAEWAEDDSLPSSHAGEDFMLHVTGTGAGIVQSYTFDDKVATWSVYVFPIAGAVTACVGPIGDGLSCDNTTTLGQWTRLHGMYNAKLYKGLGYPSAQEITIDGCTAALGGSCPSSASYNYSPHLDELFPFSDFYVTDASVENG
jgi:hypothetical protein